ncbi:MAG: type I-U CRISPR-associated protein Csx17 [Acidimicrobiales bacterium]
MTIVELPGCRPTPLLSYLQGLGVARLVHEQLAAGTRSFWAGNTLCLDGDLDQDEVIRFLLDEYRPTPMVSPWNGGGGFKVIQHQKGEKALAAIESHTSPRFDAFKKAIAAGREAWGIAAAQGWVDGEEKMVTRHKPEFLATCRNIYPDDSLNWLDAAAVIADGETRFPLLLGTGGNLGRGDLSTNMMEALVALLDEDQKNRSRELLQNAVFGTGSPQLDSSLVGQFAPGAAGGINSWIYGDAPDAVNLWSFVLAMEGTLLFASGVARRFDGSHATATMPFTVNPSRAGYAGGSDEAVKGEFWAPQWARPLTAPELRRILAEGRIDWRHRHAGRGVDAAKAVCALGVDRGLHRFERYVVAERFGQMTLAVPAGSFDVAHRRSERVDVLADVDGWVDRFRGRDLPAAARSALRRFDTAQLEVVRRPDSAIALQELVMELAHLEILAGLTDRMRDLSRSPAPPLRVDRWAPLLDDGSVEWRLALAVATQSDSSHGRAGGGGDARGTAVSSMLRPVRFDPRRRRWEWSNEPAEVSGLARRSLDAVLSDLMVRRAVRCGDRRPTAEVDATVIGSGTILAYDRAKPVSLTDLRLFLDRRIDDRRLGRLISAAALLDAPPAPERVTDSPELIDPVRALLAPFFIALPIESEAPDGTRRSHWFTAGASWPQQLRAGQTSSVLRQASVRLRAAGYEPAIRSQRTITSDPARVLASLAIPLDLLGARMALESVCPTVPLTPAGETE